MSIKGQLESLHAERKVTIEKCTTLVALGDTQDEGLTDEQLAEFDTLEAEVKDFDVKITALVDREKEQRKRVEAIAEFPDHSESIAGIRGVHVPEPSANGRPAIPARCRWHNPLTAFKGSEYGMNAEERAYRFGQWAMAKLSIDMPGKYHFAAALQFSQDQFGINPRAVHGEGSSDTTGAHVFVPDEFGMDLIKLREQYGVARGLLRVRNMTSDTRTDPRRTGGLTAYFTGENSAGTESDAAYDDVKLTAEKLMAITRMSKELNEDSVIDFGNELAEEIGTAFALKEDQCAFIGDGTSTYGGMTGVRTQLDTLTAGTAPGLTLGAGNAYSELTLANFESVAGSLPQYADIAGQVSWVCHKTFAWTVMKSLALAAGGNTKDDIEGGGGMSFLGYPVVISQVLSSVAANNQIPVLFGNFQQGASLGTRRGETIEFSDQATVGGQSLWERDQIAAKGTERFDINVHDFGSDTVAGPICGLQMAGS